MGAVNQIRAKAYPGKVAIKHAIAAAREIGLDVAGFKIGPDGSIEITERAAPRPSSKLDEEYERMMAAGLL